MRFKVDKERKLLIQKVIFTITITFLIIVDVNYIATLFNF